MKKQENELVRAIVGFAIIAALFAIAAHLCYLEQLNY